MQAEVEFESIVRNTGADVLLSNGGNAKYLTYMMQTDIVLALHLNAAKVVTFAPELFQF